MDNSRRKQAACPRKQVVHHCWTIEYGGQRADQPPVCWGRRSAPSTQRRSISSCIQRKRTSLNTERWVSGGFDYGRAIAHDRLSGGRFQPFWLEEAHGMDLFIVRSRTGAPLQAKSPEEWLGTSGKPLQTLPAHRPTLLQAAVSRAPPAPHPPRAACRPAAPAPSCRHGSAWRCIRRDQALLPSIDKAYLRLQKGAHDRRPRAKPGLLRHRAHQYAGAFIRRQHHVATTLPPLRHTT